MNTPARACCALILLIALIMLALFYSNSHVSGIIFSHSSTYVHRRVNDYIARHVVHSDSSAYNDTNAWMLDLRDILNVCRNSFVYDALYTKCGYDQKNTSIVLPIHIMDYLIRMGTRDVDYSGLSKLDGELTEMWAYPGIDGLQLSLWSTRHFLATPEKQRSSYIHSVISRTPVDHAHHVILSLYYWLVFSGASDTQQKIAEVFGSDRSVLENAIIKALSAKEEWSIVMGADVARMSGIESPGIHKMITELGTDTEGLPFAQAAVQRYLKLRTQAP